MRTVLFLIIILLFSYGEEKSVYFNSFDEIKIYGSLLFNKSFKKKDFIIFLHQSNWNHHEFDDIANTFFKMGYNSLSVDLRYGNKFKNSENKTQQSALKNNKRTDYMTSIKDLKYIINFVKKHYTPKKMILLASSISASIVLLYVSNKKRNDISAIFAFSPGEYFAKDNYLKDNINIPNIPVFIAGTKEERQGLLAIFKKIQSRQKALFTPVKHHGQHGAKALWKRFKSNNDYWQATLNFLYATTPYQPQ